MFPESGRGLGHVTPKILAVRSAILATAWLLVHFTTLCHTCYHQSIYYRWWQVRWYTFSSTSNTSTTVTSVEQSSAVSVSLHKLTASIDIDYWNWFANPVHNPAPLIRSRAPCWIPGSCIPPLPCTFQFSNTWLRHCKQESRAAARNPRDAASVLFGWSSPTTFLTSIRLAVLRKPSFRAPNMLAQNTI